MQQVIWGNVDILILSSFPTAQFRLANCHTPITAETLVPKVEVFLFILNQIFLHVN